ncbi:MAG: sensor histidine kinase, partial [Pseudomonadota bacterium]
MFFDDRLATVLRQRGDSEASARTQFRQLLDILGGRKYGRVDGADQSLIAAAWLRMDALAKRIPAAERAAMIREPGWRFRNADLAAHLSDFEPQVASAALNRADLSADEWTALIPRLPVRARGFLRLRRDLPVDADAMLERLGVYDRGLPQPSSSSQEQAGPEASAEAIDAAADKQVRAAATLSRARASQAPAETGSRENQENDSDRGSDQGASPPPYHVPIIDNEDDFDGPLPASEPELTDTSPPYDLKPELQISEEVEDPEIAAGRSEISAL